MLPSKDRGAVPCQNEEDPECYGGLARIATACKARKKASPASLCLDAGDSFSGGYWTDVDTDATYLEAMNTFVDAYVVGNHDFDKGIDNLAAFIDNATFPVLGACNLDLSAEPRLQGKIEKWATFNFDGTNVAILGFSNVDQSPAMATITGSIRFFEPSDPMGMVACINEFKFQNPGPWVIGILSHAGISGDLQLIRNVNSIQLDVSFVVGGHSHEPFFEAKRGRCLRTEYNATLQQTFCDEKSRETSRYEYPADAPSGAGTIKLLHAGWAGKYVGQATFTYNPATLLLSSALGNMVPAGVFFDDALAMFQIEGDSQITQLLAPDAAALAQYKTQPIAVMPEPLLVTQPLIYRQEQPAGGVLCSALMWSARNLGFIGTPDDPLVCLQNAQTIRRPLEEGPVTISDIENMLPPDITLTIIEVDRATLVSALENSVSMLNTANGEVADDRFAHIGGGLQFTYDVARQPYRFNRTSGELLQAGTRVTGVTYDCGELPEGTVRIVLNSQLAEGVQDYFGLKDGETLLTFGPLLSEALAMYLDAAAPQDGQVPAAVVSLPLQINAPPPCESADAWKDVAAAPWALAPLPGAGAAAPSPAAVEAAAPPPPAANASQTPPASNTTAGPAPPAGGSAAGAPPPPPPPGSTNTSGATPADSDAEAGTPEGETAEEDVQPGTAASRTHTVAAAAAAVAACMLLAA